MTAEEIRVLQEFRRINAESMPLAAIKGIKHPANGGEAPVLSLVAKGFLSTDDGQQNFALTPKAKEFLTYDPKPEFEEGAAAAGEGPPE